MPESKGRDKATFTAPRKTAQPKLSPRWWAPTFITLLIAGVIYLCVFYLSNGTKPIANIGYWNLVVGLAIMMAGFVMTVKWR